MSWSSAVGRYRVAVDIGEAFTDVVAFDEATGSLLTAKVPSTPSPAKSPATSFLTSYVF